MTLDGVNGSHKHPVALELENLRNFISKLQSALQDSAVQLRRQNSEANRAQERALSLEQENEELRAEIDTLRTNSDPDTSLDTHPATLKSQQMTVLLRQANEKITALEDALHFRATELVQSTSEATKAKNAAEGAYELAARLRAREEEAYSNQRALELKIRHLEGEKKMGELVIVEYAALVRSLETKLGSRNAPRPSQSSSAHSKSDSLSTAVSKHATISLESLPEGKLELQKLFREFSDDTNRLQLEIGRLQEVLDITKSQLEAERKRGETDRQTLGKTNAELESVRLDDRTAAKMVSRYMKFSQSSIDKLQEAILSLKTRHEATTNSFTVQIVHLSNRLQVSELDNARLQRLVDDFTGDLLKEAYGRRREVALRLRLLGREERLQEQLSRWIRHAQEMLSRADKLDHAFIDKILAEPILFLQSLNGEAPQFESASYMRLVAAESMVDSVFSELQSETARRIMMEKLLVEKVPALEGSLQALFAPNPVPVPDEHQPTRSVNSVEVQTSPKLEALNASASGAPNGIPHVVKADIDADVHDSSDVSPEHLAEKQEVSLAASLAPEISPTDEKPTSITPLSADAAVTPSSVPQILVSDSSPFSDQCSLQMGQTSQVPAVAAADVQSQSHPTPPPAHPEPLLSPILPSLNISLPPTLIDLPTHSPSPPNAAHPLLSKLNAVSHRYDAIQRALRDCHLALEALKVDLANTSYPTSAVIKPEIVQAALHRLDDYTEDARVELEIRKADEELLIAGYETLLSMPDASPPLTSSMLNLSLFKPSPATTRGQTDLFDLGEDEESLPNRFQLERQIESFVDGTDPLVHKAQQVLQRKLEDVQHDIAALKRAVYDPEEDEASHAKLASSSLSWTSWITGSPAVFGVRGRKTSAAPSPTFGSIMTTPTSSRHASFASSHSPPRSGFGAQQQRSRPGNNYNDPFSALGLRVPMPSTLLQLQLSPAPSSATTPNPKLIGKPAMSLPRLNVLADSMLAFPDADDDDDGGDGGGNLSSRATPRGHTKSQSYSSSSHLGHANGRTQAQAQAQTPKRSRTTSTMYMVGLGARGGLGLGVGVGAMGRMPVNQPQQLQKQMVTGNGGNAHQIGGSSTGKGQGRAGNGDGDVE